MIEKPGKTHANNIPTDAEIITRPPTRRNCPGLIGFLPIKLTSWTVYSPSCQKMNHVDVSIFDFVCEF